MPWTLPSHKHGREVAVSSHLNSKLSRPTTKPINSSFDTKLFNGPRVIHSSLAFFNELLAPQIRGAFGTEAREEKIATHIAAINIKIRKYQKESMDIGTARRRS